MNQVEREEEQLDNDLAQGRITREEYRKELRGSSARLLGCG